MQKDRWKWVFFCGTREKDEMLGTVWNNLFVSKIYAKLLFGRFSFLRCNLAICSTPIWFLHHKSTWIQRSFGTMYLPEVHIEQSPNIVKFGFSREITYMYMIKLFLTSFKEIHIWNNPCGDINSIRTVRVKNDWKMHVLTIFFIVL